MQTTQDKVINYNDPFTEPLGTDLVPIVREGETDVGGYVTLSDLRTYAGTTEVVDNLDSTSDIKALSANQGRVLNGLIAKNSTDIQANSDAITELGTQIKAEIYGLQINHETGETVRTAGAIGLNFGSPDGINPIQSDFDNCYPYNSMATVKINPVGEKKYLGEVGYEAFDGSHYKYIPTFFARDITIGKYRNISISNKPLEGYVKIPERYVACFQAGEENGILVSKPNFPVRVNLSYNGFQNKLDMQSGVFMYDMTTLHALLCLSYIEMGSLDHKGKLGRGINSGMPYGSSGYDIKVGTTGNTVTVDSTKPFYVGMLVQIGTAYTNNSIASDRFIISITDNLDGTQTLTLGGEPFTVSVGDTCVTWAQPVPQEAIDALNGGSGYYLQFGSENRSHVSYRDIWDIFGNAWQFVAGFMRYDGQFYGCTDPTKMNVTDPRNAEGWVDLGLNIQADNGYQKVRKAVQIGGGYIDVPIEWGSKASSQTFYSAYLYWFSSEYQGVRVLHVGGYWCNGADVSPVSSFGNSSPWDSSIHIGSRVIRY